MKATIVTEKEYELKNIRVSAHVRYWDDCKVRDADGGVDITGESLPLKNGGNWQPVINLDSGIIEDWENGVTANIHFKVCDQCSYSLEDETGEIVLLKEDEYVPDILCPEGDGYGDYIIMKVDENGKVDKWKADLSDILERE